MINLFLDDIRNCKFNDFIIARSYEECIDFINKNKINTLSLDHDLGTKETGYDVCKYIVCKKEEDNIDLWPNEIYLHTDNPVGRQNMFQLLNRYAPEKTKIYSYRKE